MASGTSLRKSRRRWYVAGGVVVTLAALISIGLIVVYPRVAASKIREKVTDKVTRTLGREVRVGTIDVAIGHAVLRNVDIRGPLDGDKPLVHIDRIDIDFDGARSLVGSIRLGAATIDGVVVTLRRGADGRDNLRDVIERVRADRATKTGGGGDDASKLPTSITVTRGKLTADDLVTGATALIGQGTARWVPGELVAEAQQVSATTLAAPKASAAKITIRKSTGKPPEVAIEGGEVAVWPRLALSGIGGTVVASADRANTYVIDLAGGYGGVPGKLWTAKGGLDTGALTASIDLEAAKFQLERLGPILERSAIVDYQSTSIDTAVHLELDRAGARFAGEFHLHGLNVGHPMIAEREVHGLDLSGKIAGAFDRETRKLELTHGDFRARDLPFSITGSVIAPRRLLPEPPVVANAPRTIGPNGMKELHVRLVIPPIDCQRVLAAFPTEMAPYLAGYRLRGMFDVDVHLDVDWATLDTTQLDGHVGIKQCRVVDSPTDSPKRLKEEFEHYVEVEKGQWLSFIVGPTNEDFVPIEDVSPNLIKSIMSTEDSAFYSHRGFIPTEFRTALVNDLKAGAFRYGASSITMQMVKNVLLYREKTLARKLQELFLTWHVENTLSKDRILEIYLNVIEYGPGLYGIGPAAKHFFGKAPKDLNPVEAAFFSTILPNPKDRYRQFCQGTLTKWTSGKIERILSIMLKRERLTQNEYDTALVTPLLFVRDDSETEEDCLKRVKKAIKNARSTNPLKR
ncbi:MAG: transglycosylase domain-containing protein [Deltaproteobacteria bacterium]|nr:transglycosylase domain-containing protein [Deltaproteobacteria bacterium]